MRRTALFFLVLLTCAAASAQSTIPRARTGGGTGVPGTFSIGGRYSNHSTTVDMGLATIETGRQGSLGIVGGYRAGQFVLDFMADKDPENGIDISDIIPVNFGAYERTRGEVTVGWAPLPILDLQGGVRLDQITLSGNFAFFDGDEFDHQALVAGIQLHSPDGSPVVVYGLARGLFGTADLGNGADTETTGYRVEGGVSIPLGQSKWTITPALEYEVLDTENDFMRLTSNRFLLNVVYTFR